MTFLQIIEKYREKSYSQREKGTKFEELIQRYFLTAKIYHNILDEVWLWDEFPYHRGMDTGIDLVAKTKSGEYWAIQCKCYKEDTTLYLRNVATFLATSGRTFKDENGNEIAFSHRYWVSTTSKFSAQFEDAISGQTIPVTKLGLSDLEGSVDWDAIEKGRSGEEALPREKEIFPHQEEAIQKAHKYFLIDGNTRGKLIMACGTGKTFTALKIAEKLLFDEEKGLLLNKKDGGLVLCLVPSIALVKQMLQAWTDDAEKPLNAICVCSDSSVSRGYDDDGYRTEDLALPASTDSDRVVRQILDFSQNKCPTVIFSTYHSIDVIVEAQKLLSGKVTGDGIFDLIVCDEAHRTTGVKLPEKPEESAFARVHNNELLRAKKRLYMTATPRLYSAEVKAKATEKEALVWSMDDKEVYGENFYKLGFGESVKRGLLADYKVLVLTLNEERLSDAVKAAIADSEEEIPVDEVAKLIGCINALSKRMVVNGFMLSDAVSGVMHRAVAFCQTIKASKQRAKIFRAVRESYSRHLGEDERNSLVEIEARHVDGTMLASDREDALNWLKSEKGTTDKTCRILTNVRCLSEGVDVPELDAAIFLSPRYSQIDVVQSVGRVMRRVPGTDKKYGYIILPVVVPAGAEPAAILDKKSHRFHVVWSVLQALRAHDDRFNAEINKIKLQVSPPGGGPIIDPDRDVDPVQDFDDGTFFVGGIPGDTNGQSSGVQRELALKFSQLSHEIYVKIVENLGDRFYWAKWAKEVGEMAAQEIKRIEKLVTAEGEHKKAFKEFCTELRQNINPALSADEVIEMLGQHIVSRPIFDVLFANHEFTEKNAISKSMTKMLDLLEERDQDEEEAKRLRNFYDSVQTQVGNVKTVSARQQIISELYEKFFKAAFPQTVEMYGIVYTPPELVDFLIYSVESVLKKEFNRSLADENVHILDPFTGTGTFITRLMQSGIIPKEKLLHKYKNEIHANELVLLAYYIACVNIENVFAGISETEAYENFPGACLTDTFQIGEPGNEEMLFKLFPENSKLVQDLRDKSFPIRVIIGNPPYSIGQKSGTTGAQNQRYEKLEKRVEETYKSEAGTTRALHDSYIKAFRWASDRIDDNGGVIAFVTNNGWLIGKSLEGFRKRLEREFSKIYLFNLRGNVNAQGAAAKKKEGEGVFPIKTGTALVILIKNKKATGEKAQIFYRDIGEYLKKEKKIEILKKAHDVDFQDGEEWELLEPNKYGDWVGHRSEKFDKLMPLSPGEMIFQHDTKSVFVVDSNGIGTGRTHWAYSFSLEKLCENVNRAIEFYNSRVDYLEQNPNVNPTDVINNSEPKDFKWEDVSVRNLKQKKRYSFSAGTVRTALRHPFLKQNLYFSKEFNHRVATLPCLFPTPDSKNLVICVSGTGGTAKFSCLMTNVIPDYMLIFNTQCYPLYYYTRESGNQMLLNLGEEEGDFVRHDGISAFALEKAQSRYGDSVSKEDIFYYIYGVLHSPDYREEFKESLKKDLPKVPFVETPEDFWEFSKAGRKLADLHLNYETLTLPEEIVAKPIGEAPDFRISKKMHFDRRLNEENRPDRIWYNDQTVIDHIPPETYDYVFSGTSALKVLMDRYAIRKHKPSGIINDPNWWCDEHNDPEYVVNLLRRVIYLSRETVKIMNSLPKINFSND